MNVSVKILLLFVYSFNTCLNAYPLINDKEAYSVCKKHDTCYVAIIWPIAQGYDEQIEAIVKKYGLCLYKKEFLFTKPFARKVLKKAHPHIDDIDEHLAWYFPQGTFLQKGRIYLLSFELFERALACKMAIRKIFNIGYRSIHMNDTHKEALELAGYFFKAS